MDAGSEAPRDLADRVIREALQHPANLGAFLHQAVPTLAAGFDCERRRLLEREFPLDDWRRREADLPFEIPYRRGDEDLWALVYVLIEHQSGEDPLMPLRLLYFVVLYWERQWRAWEQAAAPKPALRLSPVLPLVLHTGPGPWQNNRTLHDLLGEPVEFHAFVPEWAPLFWELSGQNADALLSSGDAWQETLAVLRVQGEQGQLTAARAAQADAKHQKEVTAMGQTIWEEAHAQGELRGELKGELKALRRTLRQLLADRFGNVSEAVLQRIESCADVERLAAAAVQVRHVATPEDLEL